MSDFHKPESPAPESPAPESPAPESPAPESLAAEARPAAPPSAGLPRKLGAYRILREVGRGGMGIVFEAEHETLRRHVALKVLPLGVAARGSHLERFHLEARAAGRLHHSNIVPVFEVGSQDGVYYYAMQFIHGRSLDLVFDELRQIQNQRPGDSAAEATPSAETLELPPAVARSLAAGGDQGPLGRDPSGLARDVAWSLARGSFRSDLPLIDDAERTDDHPAASGIPASDAPAFDAPAFDAPASDSTVSAPGISGPSAENAAATGPPGTGPDVADKDVADKDVADKDVADKDVADTNTADTDVAGGRAASVEAAGAMLPDAGGPHAGSRPGAGQPVQVPFPVDGRTGSEVDSSVAGRERSGELSEPGREGYFLSIARIGLQVAEALDYAHGQGIIHRDIKPSNLILDTGGVVWVTDFGLAKNEGEDLTRTGDILGTLRYMAPERLQGRGDRRSDLYGLGLTLYELCTLRPALCQQDRVGLMREVAEGEPLRPRKLNPRIPLDLETLILKSIEKDPQRRYQTARQLADDLRLFLDDRPIRARRVSPPERVWRWCRRNPRLAGLLTAVGLLLGLIFSGSLAFTWHARRQAVALAEESLRSNRRLYAYCLERAEAGRWSGRPGQREGGLEAIHRAGQLLPLLEPDASKRERESLQLRNKAIGCLALHDLRVVRRYPADLASISSWTFDSRYQRSAASDSRGNVQIRQVHPSRELQTLPGPGVRAWMLQFDPRGAYLFARYHHPTGPAELRIWDLAAGETILQFERQDLRAPAAFHPDGRTVAIGLRDKTVQVYRLGDATRQATYTVPRVPTALAYSPRGQLAIIDRSRTLHLLTSPQGPPQGQLVPEAVMSVTWSEDERLLLGGTEGNIYHGDPETLPAERFERLEGHRGPVVRLEMQPGSRRLVSASWDGTTRFWDLDGRRQVLQVDATGLTNAAFREDGRQLGFHSPAVGVGIWEIVPDSPLRILAGQDQAGIRWCTAWCPGLPELLVSGTATGLEFWDLRAGRIRHRVPLREVRSVQFSPDGRWMCVASARGVERWPVRRTPRTPVSGERESGERESGERESGERESGEQATRPRGSGEAVRIGPPETLRAGFAQRIDWAVEAGVLAIDTGEFRAELRWLDQARPPRVVAHSSLDRVGVSADGRWLVTATWGGRGVRVWDTGSGREVRNLLPGAQSATPAFSPDGRWLAVADGETLHLWSVGSWQKRWEARREWPDGWPGPLTFSPDGRLLLAASSRQVLQLLDVETGRPLARLETLRTATPAQASFSTDGHRLAVAADEEVQIWDLAGLRESLAALGLDWETTPLSLEAASLEAAEGPGPEWSLEVLGEVP